MGWGGGKHWKQGAKEMPGQSQNEQAKAGSPSHMGLGPWDVCVCVCVCASHVQTKEPVLGKINADENRANLEPSLTQRQSAYVLCLF